MQLVVNKGKSFLKCEPKWTKLNSLCTSWRIILLKLGPYNDQRFKHCCNHFCNKLKLQNNIATMVQIT